MTSALDAYLDAGGESYVESPEFERRRQDLAARCKQGPVSFAEMATILGLPLAVVCEIHNNHRLTVEASKAVKH